MKHMLSFFCGLFLSLAAFGQSGIGTLDSSFASNGIRSDSFAQFTHAIVKLLPAGGSILAIGDTITSGYKQAITLSRYRPDGSQDISFGAGGNVVIGNYALNDSVTYCSDALLQSDGKIVLAGTQSFYTSGKLLLIRLKSDATMDSSFGTNGIAILPPFGGATAFTGIKAAQQADGKLLVGGRATVSANASTFLLARFNANGTPDLAFGNNGVFTWSFNNNTSACNLWAMRLLHSGKVALLGDYYDGSVWTIALMRVGTTGTPDSSFGANGFVTAFFGSSANYGYGLDEQPDNKLIASCAVRDTSNHIIGMPDLFLLRYNENGTPDAGWGTNGVIATGLGCGDSPSFVDAHTTPKIIIGTPALYPATPSGYAYAVVRMNMDGTYDSSFGTNGKTLTGISTATYTEDFPHDMLVHPAPAGSGLFLAGVTNYSYISILKYKLEPTEAVPNPAPLWSQLRFYPNPVSAAGTLSFTLANPASLNVRLYDIAGRTVRTIAAGTQMDKGAHQQTISLGNLNPGIYYLRLTGAGGDGTLAIRKD